MHRRLLLSVLVYGLVLLGLATLQGALLALAIPFVIYLALGYLRRPDALRLRVIRTLSAERASQGAPITVRLKIANAGERRVAALFVDTVPPQLRLLEGQASVLAALEPGASVELEYTLIGRRGFYQFAGVRVTFGDTFGLFREELLIAAPGRLLIVPEISRLRRAAIRPRRTNVYAGQIPARQGGPGVEFFGVREYQPGDPTRWINGRATARHAQAVFVNEFEQERVADIGIILDARRRSDARAGDEALFEHAILAAATLASAFLERGNRVGLLMYGNTLDWTFPGYGKVQRERILRSLARAEQGDLPIFEQLDYIPTRLFPARSQLVLVSPLLGGDLAMLAGLRSRGYHVLVISPDPVAYERHGLNDEPATELAARIASLERSLLLSKLRQTGIHVVDWQVSTPFQQVADVALRRPMP